MSKEIIVCKNMDKTFETSRGAVHVIEDVTLNVHENELLVLFGPRTVWEIDDDQLHVRA